MSKRRQKQQYNTHTIKQFHTHIPQQQCQQHNTNNSEQKQNKTNVYTCTWISTSVSRRIPHMYAA